MIQDGKLEMFQNRLAKVFRHLAKQARRQQITCYRIYDRDLPEFPLIIDIYENKVYVSEYNAKHKLGEDAYVEWLDKSCEAISRVTSIPDEFIFLKQRKRKINRQDQYQKTAGEQVFHSIQEGGLKFLVNLTDYLDTGIFLDHRITRSRVQKEAAGKHILNLFCYTAAFSVYAAAGDAAEVTSVDLSKTYLKWAMDNFMLNNLYDASRHHFVHADVLQYLDDVKMNSYDIIVLDPPTFSNSKRMDDFLDIQQDHVALINKCLLILRPGGCIYFSTNYRKFQLQEQEIKATDIQDITKATTPFDFEGKLLRWCYLIRK
jgi:23S rRNA (cytosine1962-C5)-methyltransferase